jgi:hypothetical protein
MQHGKGNYVVRRIMDDEPPKIQATAVATNSETTTSPIALLLLQLLLLLPPQRLMLLLCKVPTNQSIKRPLRTKLLIRNIPTLYPNYARGNMLQELDKRVARVVIPTILRTCWIT